MVRKQVAEEEDLFLDDIGAGAPSCPEGASQERSACGDDEPSATPGNEKPKAQRARKQFNTARLDTGINTDDE